MKKLALSALAASVAMATPAAPAHAQYYGGPNADYHRNNDLCHDPGYLSATHGKNCPNFGYGGGNGYYSEGYAPRGRHVDDDQSDVTCVNVFILFGKCSKKRQPMVCYTPGGDPIVVDSKGARYLQGGNSGRPAPREVQLNCGNNNYRASN